MLPKIRRNAKWIGHTLRINCLLKWVSEENNRSREMTGRRKQLMVDLQENGGY